MTYMIFRVIFWLFVAVQVMLLLFSDKVDRHISARTLKVSFALKCVFVIVYIVCTNIAIDLPNPMILNIIGYCFLFLLLFLVWRIYLPKTIQADKAYQMSALRKAGPNSHNIAGRIQEGNQVFDVLLELSDVEFCKFDSQGYFDYMAKNKSIPVKLAERRMNTEGNYYYDAIVRLI